MRRSEKWLSAIFSLSVVLLVVMTVLRGHAEQPAFESSPGTQETITKADGLYAQGKYGEALEILLSAYKNDPENPALKTTLHKTFAKHFESEIATGFARIQRNKHDVGGYVSIANAYKTNRQYVEAMTALNEGVLENPKSTLLWLNIGLLELMRGKDAEALSVYKEVLNLDAHNPVALNNVAYVQSRSDDPRLINLKEAHAYARRAVAADPKNPNFLETLALIELKRGDKVEAKRLIKEAIALDPEESLYKSDLEIIEK